MAVAANNINLSTQIPILTTQRPIWQATPSVTQTSIFFGLAVVTVFGNALVVAAVYKDPHKNLRTISNYLVVNLAAADLFMGLVSETLWGLSLWVRSRHFYDIANATMYLSLTASCLTILGMSIERYFKCFQLSIFVCLKTRSNGSNKFGKQWPTFFGGVGRFLIDTELSCNWMLECSNLHKTFCYHVA